MFIIFPTSADVPIYHWPFATIGMIVLNVIVYALQCFFPEPAEWFMLHYGQINPITWITSTCMHASFSHLAGNMLGLAFCGWIIEGKVGWWRFILIYFGIAVISCGLEQLLLFFFASGSSLGASGVVFGMIAIAMLWAPENEIKMFIGGIFLFRPFYTTFQITVATLGFIMIAMELLTAAFNSFALSSAVLHLFGAGPGFMIGYLMIRWRRVDCDGYDLVSILKGKRGKRTLTVEQEKEQVDRIKQAKLETKEKLESGLAMVEKYVNDGHYELALNRFRMIRKTHRELVMTESQLVAIIQAFDSKESSKPKMIPLIQEYLLHYDKLKIPLTLMLARVLILLQGRPRQGLKILKTLNWNDLNTNQKEFTKKMIERAKQKISDGVLEVRDDP